MKFRPFPSKFEILKNRALFVPLLPFLFKIVKNDENYEFFLISYNGDLRRAFGAFLLHKNAKID